MRKKLDTRFPAARIKKIMQADEDVGKIAMAVPLLVSKALELFLQDLCDRTYDITVTRGAKTLNSLHLKHCVESFNVFDFLKETVSKVPELGGSEPAVEGSATKKRKTFEDEGNASDEETKKSRASESGHTCGRGRGRGRARGRGRPSRALEREEPAPRSVKVDDDPVRLQSNDEKNSGNLKRQDADLDDKKDPLRSDDGQAPIRNFDLNADPNDNTDLTVISTGVPSTVMSKPSPEEIKGEEYPGWSLSEIKSMTIDPLQLAKLNQRFDEEEDYDEDG